ncbi:MAG: helix-turn-helix domain-containing protein [Candidatus Eremiobacteraeota bacterium]|nr:helix-turn-helix domain-containing protein [Candidatus Eremiobacteraeota bacterium]
MWYEEGCEANPTEFRAFLKTLRSRIQPETEALGPHKRLPSRVGKRVTQEEIAEHVGVSREWYATLETGASTRTSLPLLARLATALMTTPAERMVLFSLGLPELQLTT